MTYTGRFQAVLWALLVTAIVAASAKPVDDERKSNIEFNRLIEIEGARPSFDDSYKNTIKYNLVSEREQVAAVEQQAKPKADKSASEKDKINAIAFNSREVRLMGPDQKEVEMKGDLASSMVVALENLQKEATEVWGQVSQQVDKGWGQMNQQLDKGWGQVNQQLDKGWTDFKTMIKGAVKNL